MAKYSKEFLKKCHSITAKRPRTVIQHILQHGQVTTEELKELYGYNHAPRAARDVKEHGIPLKTIRVVGKDGRRMAAYEFDLTGTGVRRFSGRTNFSAALKGELISKYGNKCFIYLEEMQARLLQIDHRIPYEVVGETASNDPEAFMLLCGSANRAKSWSCENCRNWSESKNPDICRSCYWAYPEDYSHVAMQEVRRTDILWQGPDVQKYDAMRTEAEVKGQTVPEFVKDILRKIF